MISIRLIILVLLSFILSSCAAALITGVGVGAVSTVAKDRSAEQAFQDAAIETKIKSILIKTHFKNLYAKISVNVVDGRVLYTGSVSSEENMMEAIKIAWNQKGVKEVINEMKIDSNSNKFDLSQYTKDSMITTQIKSKMFLDKRIKFVNYNIVTTRDVVYIFGIARSEEELKIIGEIAARIKGVKKVISHAHIKKIETTKQKSFGDTSSNKTEVLDDEKMKKEDMLIDSDLTKN